MSANAAPPIVDTESPAAREHARRLADIRDRAFNEALLDFARAVATGGETEAWHWEARELFARFGRTP